MATKSKKKSAHRFSVGDVVYAGGYNSNPGKVIKQLGLKCIRGRMCMAVRVRWILMRIDGVKETESPEHVLLPYDRYVDDQKKIYDRAKSMLKKAGRL